MKNNDWTFDYDYENDSLYIYLSNKKARESFELDNFVIDVSEKGDVVGVEILNASEMIRKIWDYNIPKDALKNIKDVGMSIAYSRDLMIIKIVLVLIMDNKRVDVKLPLSMPKLEAVSV
jgi:uncharacterized protein YuzE